MRKGQLAGIGIILLFIGLLVYIGQAELKAMRTERESQCDLAVGSADDCYQVKCGNTFVLCENITQERLKECLCEGGVKS